MKSIRLTNGPLPDGTVRLSEPKFYKTLKANEHHPQILIELVRVAEIKEKGRYRAITVRELQKHIELKDLPQNTKKS